MKNLKPVTNESDSNDRIIN